MPHRPQLDSETRARTRFAKGAKWVRNAALSPSGARVALEFRGEIVTLPREKGDDRKFSIARIVLRPLVAVHREADREKALRLIQKAEDACLVARSMRTTVELAPEVTVAVTA